MAMAVDIPSITTSIQGGISLPGLGLSIQGIGGGGTGFGDVLISPLYDVRALTDPNLPGTAGTTARSQNTLIAIVNTDPVWGVVARLRFREWKRSIECLDLDIPLTSNDVWVGSVNQKANGVAALFSPDRYVSTIPATLNTPFTTSLFPAEGIEFRTSNIEASEANPVARCLYGYFEIIGEEIIKAPTPTFEFPRVGTIVNGIYVPGVGDPPNALGAGRDVGNVLMGTTYLVRPEVAISHQFNMTAIANFAIDPVGIWNGPNTAFPTLVSAVQGQAGNLGFGGIDNLEALISKRFVDFQYSDQGVIGGFNPLDISQTPISTSVVVTFPTKWAHYNPAAPHQLGVNSAAGGPPFTGAFETVGDNATNFGEVYTAAIYDRAEHLLTRSQDAISPSPTPGIIRLPYEVNIVGLRPVDAPAADFRNNLALPTANSSTAQKFFEGWIEFDLSPAVGFSAGDTRIVPQGEAPIIFNFYNNFFNAYRGLPAIGIVMTEFFNGAVSGYFGNTVPWQYGVDWRTSGSLILPTP
jgi:hypothetical protein